MKQILDRSGFHTLLAGTGTKALEIARTQRVDLVLSDIGLPDMNGYQLITALWTGCPLKGIALTGFEQSDTRRRAGFSEQIVKPVEIDHLLTAIQRALGDRTHVCS